MNSVLVVISVCVFQLTPKEKVSAVVTYVRSLPAIDDLDAIAKNIFSYVSEQACRGWHSVFASPPHSNTILFEAKQFC